MAAEERKFQDPEYDYYDIDEEEEEGGRGPILVVVAIIVITAFVGVVLVAYNQGVKEGRQQVPPILRAEGPVREEPPDVASAEPPKSPSSQIFSPSKSAGEPEVMAPPPEEPMTAPKPAAPVASAPPLPAAPTKNVEVKAAPEPGAAPAEPAAAASAPPPATAPAPAAPAASGSYLVQIGSFKSGTEANATWEKIKAKHTDLLGGYAPNIVSVDLGAKGTYQRLRFGPFETRESAVSVCEQLKARKQDCLIAKQ